MKRLLLFAILLLSTTPAAAQFGMIEGLFKSVNSVAFGIQGAWLDDTEQLESRTKPADIQGLNAEVLINLPAPEGVFLELALGTSYLRGFASPVPGLDLRGALRTIPSIAVYISKYTEQDTYSPYIGANFGALELWNGRAFDEADRVYRLEAETLEYGVTLGLNVNLVSSINVFVEGNYKRRRFASIDWTLPGEVQELPENWPRGLNLSGFGYNIGAQFILAEERVDPGPPALSGTWVLVGMDGQDVPGLLEQQHADPGTRRRTEVLTGTLAFAADTTYTLRLQLRDSILDGDGQASVVEHPRFVEETGRYAAGTMPILLQPAAGGEPHLVERVGDGLLLRTNNGHTLRLQKR